MERNSIYISYNLEDISENQLLFIKGELQSLGHKVYYYRKGTLYDPKIIEKVDSILFILPNSNSVIAINYLKNYIKEPVFNRNPFGFFYPLGKGQFEELQRASGLNKNIYIASERIAYAPSIKTFAVKKVKNVPKIRQNIEIFDNHQNWKKYGALYLDQINYDNFYFDNAVTNIFEDTNSMQPSASKPENPWENVGRKTEDNPSGWWETNAKEDSIKEVIAEVHNIIAEKAKNSSVIIPIFSKLLLLRRKKK